MNIEQGDWVIVSLNGYGIGYVDTVWHNEEPGGPLGIPGYTYEVSFGDNYFDARVLTEDSIMAVLAVKNTVDHSIPCYLPVAHEAHDFHQPVDIQVLRHCDGRTD